MFRIFVYLLHWPLRGIADKGFEFSSSFILPHMQIESDILRLEEILQTNGTRIEQRLLKRIQNSYDEMAYEVRCLHMFLLGLIMASNSYAHRYLNNNQNLSRKTKRRFMIIYIGVKFWMTFH